MKEARIRDILLEFQELKLKPILKIAKNKHLTSICKQKIYTLSLRTDMKIDDPDIAAKMFELVYITSQKLQKMGTIARGIPEKLELDATLLRLRTCDMGKIDWVQKTSAPA